MMKAKPNFDFQSAIEQLEKEFEFDFISIALVQTAEGRFAIKWKYASGQTSDRYKRLTLQYGKGVAGTVFKVGKPMLIENVDDMYEGKDLFNNPILILESLKSFGAIPLYKYNRVAGVLLAGFRKEGKMTSELFERFKEAVGPRFGPYYNKEMVKH